MSIFTNIYRLIHPVYAAIRSHPSIISLLFSVKTFGDETIHWDTTTLLLKRTLGRVLRKEDSVFEMGVGQAALLSIWVAKSNRAGKIAGADVSRMRVTSARKTVELNGVDVQLLESNLFSHITDSYNVIFFNPPYVRTGIGRALKLTERLNVDGDQVWDGGVDGTAVIAEFFQGLKNHLLPGGSALVGVQDYYVKRPQLETLADKHNLKIVRSFTTFLNPSVVYMLQPIH